MVVTITLNGKKVEALVKPDTLLIDFVRDHGCYSVKRGCETSNCGLCTVFVNDKPVLSCSMAGGTGVNGCKVDTLEGLAERGRRIWCIYCRSGGRAVWVLQSGNDHECHCIIPGKSGSF